MIKSIQLKLIIFSIVYLASVLYFNNFYNANYNIYFYYSLFFLLFIWVINTNWIYIRSERQEFISVCVLIGSFITFLLSLFLTKDTKYLFIDTFIISIGTLITYSIPLFFVKKINLNNGENKSISLISLIRGSYKLFLNYFIATIYTTIDLIYVTKFLDINLAGIYRVIVIVGNALSVLFSLGPTILYPRFVKNNAEYEQILKYVNIITISFIVVSPFFSYFFFSFVFNKEYISGMWPAAILCISKSIIFKNTITSAKLVSDNKDNILLTSSIIAFFLIIALLNILPSKYGLYGVVFSVLITETLVYFILRKFI